jgi:glycosyltransferase involved in cell wall biosynthesis
LPEPRPLVFLVPGALETRTGGSIYDSRMADVLRRRGRLVRAIELESPDGAGAALAGVTDQAVTLVDGLVFGAIPDVVEREAARLRFVALVHLPLAAAPDLDPGTAAGVEARERRALARARLIVVTGRATIPMLARYRLPPDRIVVVEPGTDPAPPARGSGQVRVQMLCVATLNAGKGHDVLFDALARLAHLPWRLTCAGSLTRDPATAAALRSLVRDLGLADRIAFVGDLDRAALAEAYDRADLFVLATRQETYGMAVAEALARGLPVVSTATGAIPELVGGGAGLLAPPGDRAAFRDALARVLEDAALRARLAQGAARVRRSLPTWDAACRRLEDALESVETDG